MLISTSRKQINLIFHRHYRFYYFIMIIIIIFMIIIIIIIVIIIIKWTQQRTKQCYFALLQGFL